MGWKPVDDYAVAKPDTLFLPLGIDTEQEFLDRNARLNWRIDDYLVATDKVVLVDGPQGMKAVPPRTTDYDVAWIPPDGLLPVDQFTIVVPVRSIGMDALSQNSGSFSLLCVGDENLGQAAQNGIVLYLDVGVGSPANKLRALWMKNGSASSACSLPLSTGDMPADTWKYITIVWNAPTLSLILGNNTKSASASVNSGIPPTVGWAMRYGCGVLLNKAASSSNLGSFNIAFPHIMRWARSYDGTEPSTAPSITVNAASSQGSFPVDLGGHLAQYTGWHGDDFVADDTKPTQRNGIFNDIGSKGMPVARIEHIMDSPTITGSSAPFSYDWSAMDDRLDALIAAGITRIHATLGYCTSNLGARSKSVPSDYDQYAKHVSDAIGYLLGKGLDLVGLSFWNEPSTNGFFWAGNLQQFTDLWTTCFDKIEDDWGADSRVPSLGFPEDGYGSYTQGVVSVAAASGRTPSAFYYHDYGGSLSFMHRAVALCHGLNSSFATLPVRFTEWNWQLAYINSYVALANSLKPVGDIARSAVIAAYSHAAMWEMHRAGVDVATFTRMGLVDQGVAEGIDQHLGIYDNASTPAKLPAYAAFEAWWKHGGNEVSCLSNWPGVRAKASVSGDVTTISYSSYVLWDAAGNSTALSLSVSGLPSSYTWRHWQLDETNASTGALTLKAQGTEADFPSTITTRKLGVGVLQITASDEEPPAEEPTGAVYGIAFVNGRPTFVQVRPN